MNESQKQFTTLTYRNSREKRTQQKGRREGGKGSGRKWRTEMMRGEKQRKTRRKRRKMERRDDNHNRSKRSDSGSHYTVISPEQQSKTSKQTKGTNAHVRTCILSSTGKNNNK